MKNILDNAAYSDVKKDIMDANKIKQKSIIKARYEQIAHQN